MRFAVDSLPMLAVVGESHADPLMSSYVFDPASGKALAFAPYAHIPALRSEYYLDAQGRINAKIVAALCTLRLLLYCEAHNPDAVGAHVMERNLFNPIDGYGWRINPALKDTPLLFVSGEVDARLVCHAVPPHADVPTPFKPEETARIPGFAATAMISEESMAAAVTNVLAPMFRAIGLLRDIGFSTIALHSISPPTADDAQYLREISHETRALTRYKVVMLFNAAMREHCENTGFLFVDRWQDFTKGGLIRDGYGADAVHVKETHMRITLQRLYEMTIARRVAA
jgi:hypothetical protein